MTIKRLIITPGEPAGIGADVTLMAAQHAFDAELVVVSDPDFLMARAKELNLPLTLLPFHLNEAPAPHKKSTLTILPIAFKEKVTAGILNKNNAHGVLEALQVATNVCLEKKAHALVTGAIHKEHMNESGMPFLGHTEWLANASGVKSVVMLFVIETLRLALVTTHLPLRDVPNAVTSEKIKQTLTLLHAALQTQFDIQNPRISVAGLNPHAGEGGHLGREEIETIIPALNALRKNGMTLKGPLPADTMFTKNELANADAFLAMYHDQALPVIKHIGFDRAVNVTLGLPFIRTSVDHGTALSLAGSGQASHASMIAAIQLALTMTS